jgi:homoserine kinase
VSELLPGPVSVRVPATSANLGPGFDSLGLALTLYDVLTASVASEGLEVEVEGEAAATVPRDERHLVVRAAREGFAALGAEPPGFRLRCVNAVPHGRGLGSSSAAIVGGLLVARALVVGGTERLPDEELLALAARIEGHPDNVAPAVLGGLTIAWSEPKGFEAVRLEVDTAVRAVAFVPPEPLSTAVARGLLPETVPHGDASANAGRAALLVAALTGQVSPEALLAGTDDRLHQQYRAPAMPDSAALVTQLRSAGVAAFISGAGPTVLALVPEPSGDSLLELAEPLPGWRVLPLEVDRSGATVLD